MTHAVMCVGMKMQYDFQHMCVCVCVSLRFSPVSYGSGRWAAVVLRGEYVYTAAL